MSVKIKTPKKSYTIDYPEAIQFSEIQEDVFWTAKEIEVEKDIQDIRVNMTEAEAHGVITTLRLFTLYELIAGTDYWLGRVMRMFPRPDIHRMAATFGFFELNVHAPFYNKINEALMINTDDFYLSYVDDPILRERMEFVEGLVTHKEDLVSLGAFSMVEGAVLYSSFAFLKHFQSKGKNKMKNVVSGINFSVRDENLHCEGGAWLFHKLKEERLKAGLLSPNDWAGIETQLYECAKEVYKHECRIVDMIFEGGDIDGITKEDMKSFVAHRVNLCLERLGLSPALPVTSNPIASWFYDSINSVQFHDFFAGQGNEYNRDWTESKFTW